MAGTWPPRRRLVADHQHLDALRDEVQQVGQTWPVGSHPDPLPSVLLHCGIRDGHVSAALAKYRERRPEDPTDQVEHGGDASRGDLPDPLGQAIAVGQRRHPDGPQLVVVAR